MPYSSSFSPIKTEHSIGLGLSYIEKGENIDGLVEEGVEEELEGGVRQRPALGREGVEDQSSLLKPRLDERRRPRSRGCSS